MGNSTFKSDHQILFKRQWLVLLFAFFAMGGNAFAATYYSKLTGAANLASTWGTNPDGTGTAPSNFTTSGDVFILRTGANLSLGANWTIGSNVTLEVNGILTATQNNHDITINGTIDFNGTSSAQFILSGGGNGTDMTVNGTIRTANSNGVTDHNNASVRTSSGSSLELEDATVTFDGTAQTANGLEEVETLNVNSATSLTLVDDVSASTVNLNSGILILGSNDLTMTNLAFTSPSSAKMIVASGSGALRRRTPSAGTYVFPVGDNTSGADYSPVSITVSGSGFSSSDYISVRVLDSKHSNNSSVGNFLTRHWIIRQNGITNPNITASGTYVPADVTGSAAQIASARLIGNFNVNSNPWVKGAIADGDVTATGGPLASSTNFVLTGISAQDPTVSINGGDVSVCSGTSVALSSSATGNTSLTYSWSPATFLSSATNANPTVNSPTATTNYTVTVRDANGITGSDNTTITVLQNVTYYADGDGDTFGDFNTPQVSCIGAPAGYVLNSTDCDDTNPAINSEYSFYVDADQDGFGTGELVAVCAVNASTPPTGYSLNNTDCADLDNAVNTTFPFYIDADGDGFGVGSLVPACAIDGSTPPAGYSLNNTDCDDSQAGVFALFNFYVDFDGDGYGTGEPVEVCASAANLAPAGYSLTGGDCNDNIFTINPGKTEILYNGVDDDCSGTIDDNNQILSQIVPEQCGATLSSISSLISAVSFNNSTMYRFEVTNLTTEQVFILDRPLRYFSLTMLPQFDYSTTYSVRVEVQRNGTWLGYYGPACEVSSPNVLGINGAAQLVQEQCGVTLATINTLIASKSVPNSTKYRFRITNLSNPAAPNQVQTIDRDLRWFALTMLTTFNYGTEYMIEVAVRTNGEFTGYGSPCFVATPAVPTLTPNFCGAVIPAKGTLITTLNRSNTTSYRFEITNLSNNNATTIDRPGHWFSFLMIPGYAPNTQYGIRVALMTSGSYSPFGESCVITSPGASRMIDGKEQTEFGSFEAVAYPNPFAGNFNLMVNGAPEAARVKVYDLTGRLLESLKFNPADGDAQIGDHYPSGVYTVIVEQGDNTKTLRVIKR